MTTITVDGKDITSALAKNKIRDQTWQYTDGTGLFVWALKNRGNVGVTVVNFAGNEARDIALTGSVAEDESGTVEPHEWARCSHVLRLGQRPSFNVTTQGAGFLEEYTRPCHYGIAKLKELGLLQELVDHHRKHHIVDETPKTPAQGSPRMEFAEMDHALVYWADKEPHVDDLIAWVDRQLDWRALHHISFAPDRLVTATDIQERSHEREELGQPCWDFDRQHFTVDQIAVCAALTNDPLAHFTLEAHIRAIQSMAFAGKFSGEDNARALYWPLRAASLGLDSKVPDAMATYEDLQIHSHSLLDSGAINMASRSRNDHGYCGVITWMVSALESLAYEPDRAPEYTLEALRRHPERGAWVDDYDIDRDNIHTNPAGSNRTNPFMPWKVCADYWLAKNADMPDQIKGRPPFMDVGEFDPALKGELHHRYLNNNIFRIDDKNAAWPLILRGLAMGFQARF